MIKVRYIGVMFPEAEFGQLREAYQHHRDLQGKCRPQSDEHLALKRVLQALTEAAVCFTRDLYFRGGRLH